MKLNDIMMKDRKLKAIEILLLANALASSNMGVTMITSRTQGPGYRWTELVINRHEHDDYPIEVKIGLEHEKQYSSQVYQIKHLTMNQQADSGVDEEELEDDYDDEAKSWIKKLHEKTLADIGNTWKNLKPVTDKMMTYDKEVLDAIKNH